MDDKLRILIADVHRGARQALRALLERQPDVRVVGVADSLTDTLAAAGEFAPDVVLLDGELRDAVAALRAIGANRPRASSILLMVAPPDAPDEQTARRLGADGAIAKTAGRDAVMAAIRRAVAGAVSHPPDELAAPSGGDAFPVSPAGDELSAAARRDASSPLRRGFSLSLGGGTHDLATSTAEARSWRFREAMSRWATGVAVVTCRDGDALQGITASSLCSLSLEPPLALIAIGEGQRILPALLRGRFTVCILGADQQALAEHFAGQGDATLQPELLDDDVLAGSRAALICALWADYPGGDHRIVVGRVERVWLGTPDEPLLYFRRDYLSLDGEREPITSGTTTATTTTTATAPVGADPAPDDAVEDEDDVTEASMESFPASDPPGWRRTHS